MTSDGVTDVDEIKKRLGGASIELQNFGASVGYAIPKMEKFNEDAHKSAHPLQALGSNLKNIGLSLLLRRTTTSSLVRTRLTVRR